MKNFSLITVIISFLVFGFSMYYEFSIVPDSKAAKSKEEFIFSQIIKLESTNSNHPEISALEKERAELFETSRAQVEIGTYLLMLAGLSFILSIVPALRKQKIAWMGVVFSLIALFIAAARATHMFS